MCKKKYFMKKIETKFTEIRAFCESNANPEIVKKYAKFFTEGYDAYGIDNNTFIAQRDKWLAEWKDEMTIHDYLHLGSKLIATGKYEEAGFAISFMYSNDKELSVDMFDKLGLWLEEHVTNWGSTDVISGKLLAYFFINNMLEIEALNPWVNSKSIWKRRAIPVTLVEVVKTEISIERILSIIDPLMMDEAKKVQQGLGWLLRETWKVEPGKTEEFLLKWKDSCGRTIIQYATEKMTKEYRLKFRRNKKK